MRPAARHRKIGFSSLFDIIPKHFVSRDRLKLPAAAGYWVHAPGGAPLLCLHKQVDPGMVAELRSAIVPQLEGLGLLKPRPGAGELAPRLTLAFDREGGSPQLFAQLQARGIACVTWRKGPQQERWLDAEFRAAEIPLRTPFGEESGRACIAERAMTLLPSKLTVREIRFWIDERQPPARRRQPAIVTTHPTKPAEQVAGLLRSHWSQEASFKWMRQEYALDTLAEHATEEVAGGTRVVNPGSREIGKGLDRLKAKSGRLRRRQAQLGRKSTPKARAERQRVKAEIQAVEKDIAALERARSSTPSHVLAGELPEELRLRALPGARRGLLDGLRMIAYRPRPRWHPSSRRISASPRRCAPWHGRCCSPTRACGPTPQPARSRCSCCTPLAGPTTRPSPHCSSSSTAPRPSIPARPCGSSTRSCPAPPPKAHPGLPKTDTQL